MSNAERIVELRGKYEENPRRYFAPLANEYRKAGDLEQAIAICREHLPKQPGHMSGYIVFGQTLFEADRLDEAQTVFEQALALDPENLIALKHLGDIARLNGDKAVARRWYARVLDADPRNDDIAVQLASLGSHNAGIHAHATVPPAPAESLPVDEPVGVFAAFNAEALMEVPRYVAGISANDEPWEDKARATPHQVPHADALDLDFPASFEPEADEAFEEGILAPEWPDTTDLVARVVTPVRMETPVASLVTADDAAAFGREQSELPAGVPPERGADDGLVDAFLPPETGPLEPDHADEAPTPPDQSVDHADAAPSQMPDEPPAERAITEPSQPFVTATMAELFVAQGYTARALEVYTELTRLDPDNAALAARLSEVRALEQAGAAPAGATSAYVASPFDTPQFSTPQFSPAQRTPVAPGGERIAHGAGHGEWIAGARTARERFADLSRRRVPRRTPTHAATIADDSAESLSSLFGTSQPSTPDERAARALADAFGPVAALASPASAGTQRATVTDFSFARFFPDLDPHPNHDAGPDPDADAAPDSKLSGASQAAPASPSAVDQPAQPVTEDQAQFSAWLKGLSNP